MTRDNASFTLLTLVAVRRCDRENSRTYSIKIVLLHFSTRDRKRGKFYDRDRGLTNKDFRMVLDRQRETFLKICVGF